MQHDTLGRRLLLYTETCCVDGSGFLESDRISSEERDRLKEWNGAGYVEYGRVPFDVIERRAASGRTAGRSQTEWCRLSSEAWTDAALFRQQRAAAKEQQRLDNYGKFRRWDEQGVAEDS